MEKKEFTFSDLVLDGTNGLSAEETIHYYIAYYRNLLKYTKQSVRRKKVLSELAWWEEELIEHQEMIKSLKLQPKIS